MAIAVSALTSGGSTTNATSYTTSSFTRPANMMLAIFSHTIVTAPVSPALSCISSGLASTFFPVALATLDGYTGATRTRVLECWAAPMVNNQAGTTVTIDFGTGNTQTGCLWAILSVTGGLGSTSQLNSAIRRTLRTIAPRPSPANSNLSGTRAFLTQDGRSGNGVVFAFAHGVNEATTPDASLTEIADVSNADAGGLEVAWANSYVDPGIATWATGTPSWAAIGLELAVSGNAGFQTNPEAVLYA